jgi:hypothetical protein
MCLPLADKLQLKLHDEEINRTHHRRILMIREAKSPTLAREMLLAYLPERHRHLEVSPKRRRRQRNTEPHETMARRKRRRHAAGGHGWFVTCRLDNCSSHFVILVAFRVRSRQAKCRRLHARCLRRASHTRYPASLKSRRHSTRPKL